jgi:hypothetical protein
MIEPLKPFTGGEGHAWVIFCKEDYFRCSSVARRGNNGGNLVTRQPVHEQPNESLFAIGGCVHEQECLGINIHIPY